MENENKQEEVTNYLGNDLSRLYNQRTMYKDIKIKENKQRRKKMLKGIPKLLEIDKRAEALLIAFPIIGTYLLKQLKRGN